MSAKANQGSRSVWSFTRILCAVSAVFLVCLSLSAQVNTGRILGTVTDQSGGVVAGAMVAVTNSQTGVARNLVTDQAGEYLAPNLNPGTYTVRATANGFQAFERQNILLEIGKDARIDAQLTPGQITQTIEVKEAVPLLDSTSATIAGTLDTSTILDLPLNGRNYQNLLVLRPGVTIRPGGGTLTTSTNGLGRRTTITTSRGWIMLSPLRARALLIRLSHPGTLPRLFPSMPSRNSTSKPMRRRNSVAGPDPL
jgi:hypothetical protein